MLEISYTSIRISCLAELQNSVMDVGSNGPRSEVCTVFMLAVPRQRYFKQCRTDSGNELAKSLQIRNLRINLEERKNVLCHTLNFVCSFSVL